MGNQYTIESLIIFFLIEHEPKELSKRFCGVYKHLLSAVWKGGK